MDFELAPTQQALASTLESVLARHLSPRRARDVIEAEEYDFELESALRAAGFFDLFTAGPDAGPLDAVLAVERIASALGSVTSVAHMLVLPALGLDAVTGPVALAVADSEQPVRYGNHACRLVRVGTERCHVGELVPGQADPVPSVYGYPLARVTRSGAEAALPIGSGERAADWWRVGLAAEAVGLMRAALDVVVQYAQDRTTFGRPIGSLQALQHRLAECSVAVEGARWLVYEAAALEARGELAATAAAHTVAGLTRLTRECHQIMGAIGLTREHDLHLWTFRMQVLRAELGGVRAHRRRLVEQRWLDADQPASVGASARTDAT